PNPAPHAPQPPPPPPQSPPPPPPPKAAKAQRATAHQAATQPGPRDSSKPQGADGQTEARSAREGPLADPARTTASAKAHSAHPPPPPEAPAAKACNPHIAQPAAKTPARDPHNAPHSLAKHPAPKAQATNRPPRCDAAQAKAHARAPQAQTDALATAHHAPNQTK